MWAQSFGAPGSTSRINLSTSSASSSNDLLSNVRAERQAREQHRKEDASARLVQRVWRGRRDARRTRDTVLDRLISDLKDGGQPGSAGADTKPVSTTAFEAATRRLVGTLRIGALVNRSGSEQKTRAVLEGWVKMASSTDPSES